MSENNKKGNMPAWHIAPFGVSCLFPRCSEPVHNSKIFLFVNFWLKLLKHLPNFLTTSSDLCNGIKCAFQRNRPKATPSFLCCYFCFLWVQAVSRLPDVTERWRLGTGASFGIQNLDIFKMRRSLLSKVLFFLNCGFFFLLETFETKAEQTVNIAWVLPVQIRSQWKHDGKLFSGSYIPNLYFKWRVTKGGPRTNSSRNT